MFVCFVKLCHLGQARPMARRFLDRCGEPAFAFSTQLTGMQVLTTQLALGATT